MVCGQNPQTMALGSGNGAGEETEVQSPVIQRQRGRRRGGASILPSSRRRSRLRPPPTLGPPAWILPSQRRQLGSQSWWLHWWRRGCSCRPRPARSGSRTSTTSRRSTSGASWCRWRSTAARYGTRSRTSLLPKEWADAQDVSLVVNVASECGFTDQHYRALQQLQRDLGPHHFNVLAFPCNQFGQQEPDTNKEIESFARRTYSVSFPMFSKVAVTGAGAHPAFKYLIQTSGKEPTWNFWKYLVAPDGKVVGAWDPTVSVEEIKPQITALVRKLILKKREDL